MSGANQHQLDPELMEDFFNDFREAHQDSENILIDLEHDPNNTELLNALFRSVHTIKGNLIYVGLKDLTPLIQSVEDLLDAIRNKHLLYDSLLSDLILISMDRTKQMVESKVHRGEMIYEDKFMDHLCQTISTVAESSPETRAETIANALVLLDPSIDLRPHQQEIKPTETSTTKRIQPSSPIPHEEEALLAHFTVNLDDDLSFFRSLVKPLENRSLYWQGRTTRLLRIALAMNAKAGNPIEAEQIAAAVYLHDIGMAFMPLDVLHKTSPLNSNELEALHGHPAAAFQLLSAAKRWDQAANAVLQHHEHVDGNGYPNKLDSKSICDGAKILAIADAFEARTHERAYATQLKRPLIRAVLEINRCSGSQFDPQWVEIFNETVRETHQMAS
ncbi:MAG: HD domain-containing protein [Pseudomonadales bacterium]|nr:HD domain-containing protein [Pseudomonadales bacterium]